MHWAGSRSATPGREPVIVGGTGFYVRALVEAASTSRRSTPEASRGAGAVAGAARCRRARAWCRRLDPARASLGRTQRLRAVETALLTGSASATGTATRSHVAPAGAVRYLVVDPGPVLASHRRSRRRHDRGRLARRGADTPRAVPFDARRMEGDRIRRCASRGRRGDTEEAVQRVIIETRQYAKRQRTWYRHQLPSTR